MTPWAKAKAAALKIREGATKKAAIHSWALATIAALKKSPAKSATNR